MVDDEYKASWLSSKQPYAERMSEDLRETWFEQYVQLTDKDVSAEPIEGLWYSCPC